ncbi:hypothetical protein BJF89_13900 [Corynebacterium sp. CNJ-954]|uniref:histone-like nucleoid-structuring protein Lsr2 n=1 Tax=Corynebacterium sp. CNJ-954 TaxID=1904962 RepID=UPI00096570B3|nr:Lsr2 family protein [Corynebacterium sp. CNJ-954]OLT55873.1 hypothetical protein BJF89_13900 [Corynebacterium sp. CNJ-954]
MARREVVEYTDDITGESLTKDQVQVVELSYGGKDYVLDLSHESSLKLATELDPWVTAARKVTRGGTPRKGASQSDKARNKAIREWAQENGYEVSARGQIAKDVIEAYDNR